MDITSIYYLTLEDNIPFYVGKTHTTLKQRLYTHWITGNNKNIQIHLIDKIPTDEWKFWECYWIEQFKIWGFNLKNKNNGGGGSTKWTQEQKNNPLRKKRLSQSLKGKILGVEGYWKNKNHSEETKQKMSMAHTGRKDTLETKKNKSESAKGKIKTQNHKNNLSQSASKSFGRPVLQKDLNNNLIKEWETGKQASIELGLSYTAINNCCRFNSNDLNRKRDKNKVGKYTSFSYIWEYKLIK